MKMNKSQKLEFITDYSISHGRQAIIRNAAYLAKQLGLTKAEVISYTVPDILREWHMFEGNPEEDNLELYNKEVAAYRDFLKSEAGKAHEKKLAVQVREAVKKIVSAPRTNMAQSSKTNKTPAHRETRTSKKSGDSNSDPDPDPERPRQLYTFKSFAQLVDCSEKTLRNKVSAGLFPQPQKTAFGPRFTQQHLDYAVTPAKPPKTRGRPRIADSIQGGVQ